MEEIVIILPGEEEMLQRLMKISDESYLRERFYPILLEQAGEEKLTEGVVLMLWLAIHDYAKSISPALEQVMLIRAPKFIDALITDPEEAERARKLLEKVLSGK